MMNRAMRPTSRGNPARNTNDFGNANMSPLVPAVPSSVSGGSGTSDVRNLAKGAVESVSIGDCRDTGFGVNYVRNGTFRGWMAALGGAASNYPQYAAWVSTGGFASGLTLLSILSAAWDGRMMAWADATGRLWQTLERYKEVRGGWLSCTCMVHATTADAARIYITDGTTTTYSKYHPGDDTEQMLVVQMEIPTTAPYIEVGCLNDVTATSAFWCFMAAKGTAYQSFSDDIETAATSITTAANLDQGADHIEYGNTGVTKVRFNDCYDSLPNVFVQARTAAFIYPTDVQRTSMTLSDATGNPYYMAIGNGRRKFFWWDPCDDVADVTVTAVGGSAALAASVTYARTSGKSWKAIVGGANPSYALAAPTLADTFATMYVSAYYYAKTGDVTWSDGVIELLQASAGGAEIASAGVDASGHIIGYNWVGATDTYTTTTDFAKDGWRLIEMRVTISATVGEIEVWYAGTKVIDKASLNLGAAELDALWVGAYRNATGAATIYIDDPRAGIRYMGYEWN